MNQIQRLVVSGLLAGLSVAGAATINTSMDLSFVVGSGANQSNLILDFNDGTTIESFAWGYRYDGVASGAEMLIAIAAADENLSIMNGGTAASGFFLSSIEYASGGIAHSGTNVFSGNNVSWGYYISGGFAGDTVMGAGGTPIAITGGGSDLPASWTSSQVGASLDSFNESGRLLSDGSWDAWSFGALDANFSHLAAPGPEAPEAAVAVPEPSSSLLALVALGGLVGRRRR